MNGEFHPDDMDLLVDTIIGGLAEGKDLSRLFALLAKHEKDGTGPTVKELLGHIEEKQIQEQIKRMWSSNN